MTSALRMEAFAMGGLIVESLKWIHLRHFPDSSKNKVAPFKTRLGYDTISKT